MSTQLTTKMQDSLGLDLYHAARGYQDRLTRHLATNWSGATASGSARRSWVSSRC